MGNEISAHSAIRYLLPCLLAIGLLAGCGDSVPTGTVKGKVTLDDEPYSDAAVVFLSMDTGQAGTADIQSDGTFSIATPLPVGTYTVYLAPKAADNEGMEATPVSIDTSVPDKYWSEMSDIKIDVAEGENEVSIPLKS